MFVYDADTYVVSYIPNIPENSLQCISSRALAKSTLVLHPTSSRDEFEEYKRSFHIFEEFLSNLRTLGINSGARELSRVCYEMEISYPWQTLEYATEHTIAREMWSFCLARWIRVNSVRDIMYISPYYTRWDQRHAFAITGPSASRDMTFVQEVIFHLSKRIPEEWIQYLVRPENWNAEIFKLWVPNFTNNVDRPNNQVFLVIACEDAAKNYNHEAIHIILDAVRKSSSPKYKCAFWRLYETLGTYHKVELAYRRQTMESNEYKQNA